MITSGTRAQILQLMGAHKDMSNMLMIATDGIYSREDVPTPPPRHTGTGKADGAVNEYGQPVNKPLGGLEGTIVDQGVVAVRPGIYYPKKPKEEDFSKLRGRGVGRKSIATNAEAIEQALIDGKEGIVLGDVERFWGMKSSIMRTSDLNMKYVGSYEDVGPDYKGAGKVIETPYGRKVLRRFTLPFMDDVDTARVFAANPELHKIYSGIPRYGQWLPMPSMITFDPRPKRSHVLPEDTGPCKRLAVWYLPRIRESEPYRKSLSDQQFADYRRSNQMLLEQPDPGADATDAFDAPFVNDETGQWLGEDADWDSDDDLI